jgi:quinol monooxygenase YgiN
MPDQFAVWATMEALPGKEEDAKAFLAEAARRLEAETGTTSFRAMEIGGPHFAIFNTFVDQSALDAHVTGPVAQWVQASAKALFVGPYDITRCTVFATMAT